jgi:hypothetical protein
LQNILGDRQIKFQDERKVLEKEKKYQDSKLAGMQSKNHVGISITCSIYDTRHVLLFKGS